MMLLSYLQVFTCCLQYLISANKTKQKLLSGLHFCNHLDHTAFFIFSICSLSPRFICLISSPLMPTFNPTQQLCTEDIVFLETLPHFFADLRKFSHFQGVFSGKNQVFPRQNQDLRSSSFSKSTVLLFSPCIYLYFQLNNSLSS